jgi:hypothetical protein
MSTVVFLVDDIVFIRPLEWADLPWESCRKGVLSLRLGRGLDYCYTKGKSMNPPVLERVAGQNTVLQFDWRQGEYDWRYPLSVDGHFFPKSEMLTAAEILDYRAPNTFERALQVMAPLYESRAGFCFESPVLLNVPLNRVQSENENVSGDVSPEHLLDLWNQGMMMDFEKLANVRTKSVHEELPLHVKKR